MTVSTRQVHGQGLAPISERPCLRQDPQRTLQGLSRLDDVPELEIYLVNRPDLPSAGAGETPIIAIAPAIANAAFRATSTSVQAMPVRV